MTSIGSRARRPWKRASADDPDKHSNSPEANARKAVRLTARQPLLVAAYQAGEKIMGFGHRVDIGERGLTRIPVGQR
jgi:citrate synthase